jgi:uncharacterized protein YidB (DUF937 family)
MNRGFPSMTALLGLLAVAGYQNRDKLAELLRGATGGASSGGVAPPQGQAGGLGSSFPTGAGAGAGAGLGGLLGGLGGAGLGSLLGGGLNELVKQFDTSGQGDLAKSWVGTGPNQPAEPRQIEQAIGPDVLDTLTQQTGLSRDEILARLSRELPEAVNQYTPQGRIPTHQELEG